jgi:dolichyl-phosphate-mannose--protein O-mannosyl transferase
LFGLLGLWFLLLGLEAQRRQWVLLSFSGLFFSASFSIKWNGLWFAFGAFLLWVLAWVLRWSSSFEYSEIESLDREDSPVPPPLYRLTQIKWLYLVICFVVLPAIFYYLIWIPHIRWNPQFDFWAVQQQILGYHQRVGSGSNVHPYCSTWYSWILMLRPVAYYYQVGSRVADPIERGAAALNGEKVIYDVHAIGNPVLWWLSSAAIIISLWMLAERWRSLPVLADLRSTLSPLGRELWIGVFLWVNYIANLLPWIPVTRCVFLYHYMGCSVFSSMLLAWLVDRWLRQETTRIGAYCVIGLAIAAFIFWMPIYLGLPLSEQEYQMRMWFRSWI